MSMVGALLERLKAQLTDRPKVIKKYQLHGQQAKSSD
jgi:hypothetical protein